MLAIKRVKECNKIEIRVAAVSEKKKKKNWKKDRVKKKRLGRGFGEPINKNMEVQFLFFYNTRIFKKSNNRNTKMQQNYFRCKELAED